MDDVAKAKARLREQVTARRQARTPAERAADATAIAAHVLELPELRQPTTVAAYASFATEPGTPLLSKELRRRGHHVLLPVLLPDRDLGWEHDGGHLGPEAIATARVVICPGLAGDLTGARLGRGGGSYDRALARCTPATLRVLLLHDNELLDRVPTTAHDERVDVIVTPSRTLRLR